MEVYKNSSMVGKENNSDNQQNQWKYWNTEVPENNTKLVKPIDVLKSYFTKQISGLSLAQTEAFMREERWRLY